jgi:hypothetical protein
MFASILSFNSQSSTNLLLVITLVCLLFVVISLVLIYFRQERINSELRLRVGDIEWLQLSEYHKSMQTSPVRSSGGVGVKSNIVVKNDKEDLDEDVANLEKDIEEMDKILEDTIDTTDEDGISEMILQMINKHEDKTVLDENLENVISTSSDNNISDNDILNKDIDMDNIEATILSTVDNNEIENSSISELNINLGSLPDTEWIEESYTMNELRDLCKMNNIQYKGTKKQVIRILLDKNVEIPKKATQQQLSK